MSTFEGTNSLQPNAEDDDGMIKAYRTAYTAADELSREVSNFRDNVSIPANNELRYAGYHCLQAINDNGTIKDRDELLKAINHCHRAMYEAADAGMITALSHIKLFQTDYRNIPVTPVISDYVNILKRADKANNLSARKRKHGDYEGIVHTDYIDMFRALKTDCSTLAHSRDELNKINRNDIRGTRRFIIVALLAVVTIVVTVYFGLSQGATLTS